MTTLFKDLTVEQQDHLNKLFKLLGELPEDATHIDFDTDLCSTDAVLKFVGDVEFFLDKVNSEWVWKLAREFSAESINYYPIPEDFNRQTGEVMSMDKPLPTEPFVNPLITEDCYVDVQVWTETEVKLAAEIFAKSTGRKIWDDVDALEVTDQSMLLKFATGGIMVGMNNHRTREKCTKLTKEQVFWSELPTQLDFPDFDFKLSCGDRPEVRQWLKDNGCVWNITDEDLTETHLDHKHLYVRDMGKVTWGGSVSFIGKELPEIQPTFTVTGFTVPESEKKRKETLDKIKEKEDTIKRLTDEINQLKNL